jgi:hypothetical protein
VGASLEAAGRFGTHGHAGIESPYYRRNDFDADTRLKNGQQSFLGIKVGIKIFTMP